MVRRWTTYRLDRTTFAHYRQQAIWTIIIYETHLRGLFASKNTFFSIRLEKRNLEFVLCRRRIFGWCFGGTAYWKPKFDSC